MGISTMLHLPGGPHATHRNGWRFSREGCCFKKNCKESPKGDRSYLDQSARQELRAHLWKMTCGSPYPSYSPSIIHAIPQVSQALLHPIRSLNISVQEELFPEDTVNNAFHKFIESTDSKTFYAREINAVVWHKKYWWLWWVNMLIMYIVMSFRNWQLKNEEPFGIANKFKRESSKPFT